MNKKNDRKCHMIYVVCFRVRVGVRPRPALHAGAHHGAILAVSGGGKSPWNSHHGLVPWTVVLRLGPRWHQLSRPMPPWPQGHLWVSPRLLLLLPGWSAARRTRAVCHHRQSSRRRPGVAVLEPTHFTATRAQHCQAKSRGVAAVVRCHGNV